jgi:tripartite-type tricarboxylate transporter receptor subunit TctC
MNRVRTILFAGAFTFTASAGVVALPDKSKAAEADGVSFTGKQMHLIVSASAGTGYDAIARAVSRHMGRHLPGNPSIVVQNMVGAGGIKATIYIYQTAPHDGTTFGAVHSGIPTAPQLTPDAAKFDVNALSWIGSANREPLVAAVWHTARVQSAEEARHKELVVGGTALGTGTVDFPLIANEILGFKFKIVSGYPGTNDINLAIERGEVEGLAGNSWTSWMVQTPQWIKEGKLKAILQFGFERTAQLPDVPLLMDYAKNDTDRKALALVLARQEYSRPFVAPPSLPPGMLAVLRRAFDATMKDPAFLDETAKQQIEIDPITGERLAELIATLAATPAPVVDRVNAIFTNAEKQK